METLKNIGFYILGIFVFIAFLFIPILFIVGSIKFSGMFIDWLYLLSYLVLAVDLLILLPLAIFKKTRPYAGIGLVISSFAFGLTLWCLGLLLTYAIWGILAVIIGLLILGIGVVPIAILATLFNGLWGHLGSLIFLIFLTFGARILGLVWVESE